MEVADTCVHKQAILSEIYPVHTQTNFLGIPFPISILCDYKSLVDSVHTLTAVQGKRLHIKPCLSQDMVLRGEIQEFRWVPNGQHPNQTWIFSGIPSGRSALLNDFPREQWDLHKGLT